MKSVFVVHSSLGFTVKSVFVVHSSLGFTVKSVFVVHSSLGFTVKSVFVVHPRGHGWSSGNTAFQVSVQRCLPATWASARLVLSRPGHLD